MANGILAWPARVDSDAVRREDADQTALAAPFVLGHRPALDGLRGVALCAVLTVHCVPTVCTGGFIGVDIFFVLSGFLITALLLQEHRNTGSISLGQFYLRRVLRLMPALLAVLAVLWVYTLIWGSATEFSVLRSDSVSVLLYLHNWRMASNRAVELCIPLWPFWSLSVEEQFYLIWPATVFVLLKWQLRRRWMVGLVLLGVVVPPALRVLMWDGISTVSRVYFATHTRADALSAGCLVALLAFWWGGPKSWTGRLALRTGAWLAAAGLLIHLPLVTTATTYMYWGGFTIVSLCAAVLLAAMLWSPPPVLTWVLETRVLGWLGRVSYGAYLWNLAVAWFVLFPTPVGPDGQVVWKHPWLNVLIIWGGTLLLGCLSHYLVERPFLRLKAHMKKPAAAPPNTDVSLPKAA